MHRNLTCSQDHRWSVAVDTGLLTSSRWLICPICGGTGAPVAGKSQVPPGAFATGKSQVPPGSSRGGAVTAPPQDYEILRERARFGMRVVSAARQRALDRPVTLETIPLENLDSAETPRLLRRFQAAAALRHPNVHAPDAVWTHEGSLYVVSPHLESGYLSEHLAGQRPPNPRAAEWVRQLAEGLHYAHRHGIVHRDLKPANVLLTADGRATVTGFDCARVPGAEPEGGEVEGAVVGTPAYMAPEQASGQMRLIGPATDVYGLGAVLYELLTGRPPFQAETALDTLVQVREKEPASPRALNPGIDRALETICLKCLRKQPAQRYATARELADDLRRYLSEADRGADGRPLRGPRLRWVQRHPIAATVLLAASVGLAASLILVTQKWQTAERERRRGDADQEQPQVPHNPPD
jgi:serine/threonine-protein kinase